MSAITIALRALPLLLPQSVLRQPWLMQINRTLPLAVMCVLIAHSLVGGEKLLIEQWPKYCSEITALILVAWSYWRWRQALVSVALGLIVLAALERCLALL